MQRERIRYMRCLKTQYFYLMLIPCVAVLCPNQIQAVATAPSPIAAETAESAAAAPSSIIDVTSATVARQTELTVPTTITLAWEQVQGGGTDIAVGPSGQVIHTNSSTQGIWWGNGITASNYKAINWTQLNGGLSKIAIGKDGVLWGVNNVGNIFRSTDTGANWTTLGSDFKDVGVGSNGNVWAIKTNGSVYFWENNTWFSITSSAYGGLLKQISVGKDGAVWGIGNDNITYWVNGITTATPKGTSYGWGNTPETFIHVSIGHDGSVWAVSTTGNLYARQNNTWVTVNTPKALMIVEGGHNGQVWALATDNTIWYASTTTVAAATQPGGSSYTYPGNQTGFSISFADAWKLPAIGKGIIKFTAKGANNLAVALAPSKASSGDIYYFGLGYSNCSIGYIRRILTADGTYNKTSANIAGTAAQLNAAEDRPYWLKIDGGTMSMGTGTIVGQNQFMTYTDPSPLAAQYIGLGGYGSSSVEYKNITIEALPITTIYDASTPPGGSTFKVTGLAGNTIDQNTTFHTNWKLTSAGKGILQFKITAAQDAWVIFGPSAKYEVGKSIALGIGGNNNAQTYFRTDIYGANKVSVADKITAGDAYWIKLENGTISYGKSATQGQNKLLEWTDVLVNSQLYFGFGGYQAIPVTLSNITITQPSTPTTELPSSTNVYDTATPPGGSTFKLLGKAANTIDKNTTFHKNWALGAGDFSLTFKAYVPNVITKELWIILSPKLSYTPNTGVVLCLGAERGQAFIEALGESGSSYIKTDIYGDNKVRTVDHLSDETNVYDYWIQRQGKTISYGRGATPGQNQIATWTNAIVTKPRYVGFGCYENNPVELSNIVITQITTTPPITPTTVETTINTQTIEALAKALGQSTYNAKLAALNNIVSESTDKLFNATVHTKFKAALETIYRDRSRGEIAVLKKLQSFLQQAYQSTLLTTQQKERILDQMIQPLTREINKLEKATLTTTKKPIVKETTTVTTKTRKKPETTTTTREHRGTRFTR